MGCGGGDPLVHAVSGLPEGEGDLVAHAEELGEAEDPLLGVQPQLAHPTHAITDLREGRSEDDLGEHSCSCKLLIRGESLSVPHPC